MPQRFTTSHSARTLKGQDQLLARFLESDEQGAKAAIFNLNRVTGRPVELEEAWIIYALVIDDGLQQIEVAQMLGRHKNWVNRRLALIERLCEEARGVSHGYSTASQRSGRSNGVFPTPYDTSDHFGEQTTGMPDKACPEHPV